MKIIKLIYYVYLKIRYKNKLYFNIRTSISKKVKIYLEKSGKIFIGKHCGISDYVDIKCYDNSELIVNKNTFIGPFSLIHCMKKITIGNDCMIGECVSIRDNDHRHDDITVNMNKQGFIKREVKIGNNVWIGAKVTILSGITIGDNSIIAANSVVNKDIPSNVIAGGVPVNIIKDR